MNELTKQQCRSRQVLTPLVPLIAPFAPHIAEELWEALGQQGTVCDAQWPEYDEKYLVENTVTRAISFNGKPRFEMTFPVDATEADIEKAVLDEERTAKYTTGHQVMKMIIRQKIVNVVIK